MSQTFNNRTSFSMPLLFEGHVGPLALPGLCQVVSKYRNFAHIEIVDWQGRTFPVHSDNSLSTLAIARTELTLPAEIRVDTVNDCAAELREQILQLQLL